MKKKPFCKPCLLYLSLLILTTGCTATHKSPQQFSQGIQARFDLAKSYLAQDQPRRSLKELLTVKDKVADSSKFHFLLGLTYSELNRPKKAIKHFQKVVEINPNNGKAWNNMGQTYYQLSQLSNSIHSFKKALSIQTYLTPEYPAYNLARIYKKQDQPRTAIGFAQKAVTYNQKYIPAYLLLSNLYLQENEIKKATNWVKKGVTANPGNIELIFILAENQLRLGQTNNAIDNFKQIMALQPKSEIAQMAKDYMDILAP